MLKAQDVDGLCVDLDLDHCRNHMSSKREFINCEQSGCEAEGRAVVTCKASDKNGVHSVIDFNKK